MEDVKLGYLSDFSLWSEALEHIASKNTEDEKVLFELDRLSNKSVISSIIDAVEKGTYKIGVPTIIRKKKDNGGYRELYVNSVQDRVLMRVISKVYYKMYSSSIHELCVSYKEGLAVGKVIKDISRKLSSGSHKGYKVDISKFFDSVSRGVLLDALNSLSNGSCVDRLVLDYYSDDRVYLQEEGTLVERYKGLAQGCALSAFLCNYILKDIDEYFSGCDIYYRYSDDIVIFDNSEGIIEELSCKLGEYGLKLNYTKLDRISSDEWFTFLGYSIKGSKISISKNSLTKFNDNIMERFRTCKTYNGFKSSVYNYLYSSDAYSCRGWFGVVVGTVNCVSDIKCLDMWVRDIFLAFRFKRSRIGMIGYSLGRDGVLIRGKGRHAKSNRLRGADVDIVSMLSLHHLHSIHKDLYLNELVIRGVL